MRTSFAPIFLAYAIIDDSETSRLVDDYVQKIPTHLRGRIRLCCPHTKEEYLAADRWMPVYLFLASLWQGHFQFTLDIDGVLLDILPLLQIKRPTTYLQAVSVGEEAYEQLKRQRNDYLLLSAQFAQMTPGEN